MHSSGSSQRYPLPALLFLLRCATAQTSNSSVSGTVPPPSSVTFTDPTGVSTEYASNTYNTSLASTQLPNNDFSDERLADLWRQVGLIATGPVTTTVSPTPEPSVYPNPGLSLHPYLPNYFSNLSEVQLPEGFVWGVASSSYQIEGAADAEGKGPSIWDFISHRVPNGVVDNSTADVAASHYYLYKQDIARLKNLGVPAFSFSISWPRIFPFGKGPINQEGIAHYDDVVNEILSNGMKVAPVLFHWETPLELFMEYGAWSDRQIVDDYFNYATFIIQRYDQYVDEWFTINEPQYCDFQYQSYPFGTYLPLYNNVTQGLKARFACGHYTLLAHAKVAKWYHEEFKGRGRITFKNSGNYFEPNSTSEADAVSVQRNYDFVLGWFNYGPWNGGDYPLSLKDTLGDNVLPTLTQDEKDMIKGSCDFFAIDGYTSFYAFGIDDFEACVGNSSHPAYPACAGSASTNPDGFPIGPAADPGASWLYNTPTGLRRFLKKITTELFPAVPDIQVSEFGFAQPFESQLSDLNTILWDLRRADYYQSYLDNILASIVYDKVNVTGAWGWAIFDNFEWASGLTTRFGLQYVNYTDLTRTPKASMFTFLNWFQQHGGERGADAGTHDSMHTY